MIASLTWADGAGGGRREERKALLGVARDAKSSNK